ncbi:GntR family transcriptional regulator [Micromonospora sp. C31]|uniref:UTRA domain-containing protein n=1 Tax=Micromonospora sp. C31 TaxID=2824876 RepID=UPI001B372096|nr:GntR family transcriptional regulator [Micromonospora sp. C31]MBQ1075839.1 GntR family transcriptional regulator [Micromonospora sp. C31]
MTSKEPPNYQRVVDDLRSRILAGELGSGNYVRNRTRLVRRAHSRDMRKRIGSTSPFARDSEAVGMRPAWEADSHKIPASALIAERLGIQPGDMVMHTRYRYLADGTPIQLADSYEPSAITGGTPVEYPEQGPIIGVVARMDSIGVAIDRFVEEVITRPAMPEEADALELDRRGGMWVISVERNYYAGQNAVETADIVVPGGRYRLVYEMPLDPWSPSEETRCHDGQR